MIALDLVRGLFESPQVRGEDDVIPGTPGRDPMAREADKLILRLEGHVTGEGVTAADRSMDWFDQMQTVAALMALTEAPGALVVTPTGITFRGTNILSPAGEAAYLGLPPGATATISARCVNQMGGRVEAHMSHQRWSFDLEAVDPPEWVIDLDESS